MPALHPVCCCASQVIENAQRKSVAGLSADYLVYSLLGYTAYTAYTAALHFNPGVQAAYMAAHAGALPDVQLTDFLFAGHALLVTMYTLYQCVLYGGNSSSNSSSSSSGQGLQTSRVANMTTAAVFAAVVAYSGHIGSTCGPDDCDAWLPMLYLLGFIKVGGGVGGSGWG
jgi:cystinosin